MLSQNSPMLSSIIACRVLKEVQSRLFQQIKERKFVSDNANNFSYCKLRNVINEVGEILFSQNEQQQSIPLDKSAEFLQVDSLMPFVIEKINQTHSMLEPKGLGPISEIARGTNGNDFGDLKSSISSSSWRNFVGSHSSSPQNKAVRPSQSNQQKKPKLKKQILNKAVPESKQNRNQKEKSNSILILQHQPTLHEIPQDSKTIQMLRKSKIEDQYNQNIKLQQNLKAKKTLKDIKQLNYDYNGGHLKMSINSKNKKILPSGTQLEPKINQTVRKSKFAPKKNARQEIQQIRAKKIIRDPAEEELFLIKMNRLRKSFKSAGDPLSVGKKFIKKDSQAPQDANAIQINPMPAEQIRDYHCNPQNKASSWVHSDSLESGSQIVFLTQNKKLSKILKERSQQQIIADLKKNVKSKSENKSNKLNIHSEKQFKNKKKKEEGNLLPVSQESKSENLRRLSKSQYQKIKIAPRQIDSVLCQRSQYDKKIAKTQNNKLQGYSSLQNIGVFEDQSSENFKQLSSVEVDLPRIRKKLQFERQYRCVTQNSIIERDNSRLTEHKSKEDNSNIYVYSSPSDIKQKINIKYEAIECKQKKSSGTIHVNQPGLMESEIIDQELINHQQQFPKYKKGSYRTGSLLTRSPQTLPKTKPEMASTEEKNENLLSINSKSNCEKRIYLNRRVKGFKNVIKNAGQRSMVADEVLNRRLSVI